MWSAGKHDWKETKEKENDSHLAMRFGMKKIKGRISHQTEEVVCVPFEMRGKKEERARILVGEGRKGVGWEGGKSD